MIHKPFGLPSGTGNLEKLLIRHESGRPGSFTKEFKVLFNPQQLKYDTDVKWHFSAAPNQAVAGGFQRTEFQSVSPSTLTLDLFLDTYEGLPSTGNSIFGGLAARIVPDVQIMLPQMISGVRPSATSVVPYVNKLHVLALVDKELHRPPRCELWWGDYVLLRGVLTRLGEEYNFFQPDGTPVRANLSCTFQKALTLSEASRFTELHSSDVDKTRVVKKGDTLSSIAQEEYHDSALWRPIAKANGIQDPRSLTPGQVLVIPPLNT